MQNRSTELTAFITSLHDAILQRSGAESDTYRITEKIMQALHEYKPSDSVKPVWLPACEYLEEAMENVAIYASEEIEEQPHSSGATSLVAHARAMQALAPKLAWWHRTVDVAPSSPFANAHANATIIGKGGLEERDDVWVGISLMAPGIEYPEHHHRPEEVYFVLSPGHWQKAGGAWFEPGITGLVHNPPNILHAMRSGPSPLLATWCLWKGD